jgi:hypothetical protein
MANQNKGLLDFLKKKPSNQNNYDKSKNKAIPKTVSAFRDILNGGGAGMEGPRFEGGPISGLLNAIGVKPLGYYDRAANYKAPLTAGQASRQAVTENPFVETTPPRQGNLGPFDSRVSTGQVDWGTNAFGPLSLIGMGANLQQSEAPAMPPRPEDEYLAMMSANDNKMSRATEPPFQPYIPPYGSDYTNWQRNNGGMPTPKGVPFNNTNGPMGALGSKVMPNASNGMPPSGMSEQMYSSWLRNQNGAINVNKMTQEGLRYMYKNYRNSPAFK